MDRSPPPPSSRRGIPYLAGPPTYLSFQKEYLLPLQPLIFLDQRLPETWPAHHLLTKHASDAQVVPDVDAFAEIYNGSAVTVVQGAPDSGYGEDRREDIKVEEFARLWRQGEPKGELIYLKDFHLCLARPDLALYRVYDLFQGEACPLADRRVLIDWVDDWMNAHALHCTKDDYRFLYLGTSGTTTAFHHDVYLSHSWSTSVCGIKRWILLAPEHAYLLNHRRTGEPIADLFAEKVGAGGDSVLDYPGSGEARQRCLVVWQYPNETMFVPSGWYHSVKNYGYVFCHIV